MPSWLPAVKYPLPKRGYWEPITATLVWCEEKYYATRYAAEVVNTLTNLLFMYLAFKGMYNCWKNGHDRIFFITFFGYLIVGSGSFAFHATLKCSFPLSKLELRLISGADPMQLVDELSMIYTTCLMFWATFAHSRPQSVQVVLGILCASLSLFITGYYHYLQDPTFHQNAYAILTAVVFFRSVYVMEMNIRPYYRKRHEEHQRAQQSPKLSNAEKAEEARKDERDKEILRTMWTMIPVGLSIFLGGFAIWGLDNVYCSTLRRWRHEIGLPWGVLLEGHGWWHLMTGVGAYFYIVWGIWLRHCLNGQQDEVEMIWPGILTSLPRVERKNHHASNGMLKASNGALKKSN